MKSDNENATENLILAIKESLENILKSGIFDEPDTAKKKIEEPGVFTIELARFVCNTRDLMNHFRMVAPDEYYQLEDRDKYEINYYAEVELGISIYPPFFSDPMVPAHIQDGLGEGFSSENPEDIFCYFKAYFTMEQQLGVLKEFLRWYHVNILSPTVSVVDEEITNSLRAFNEKLRQIIEKPATSE